LNSTFNIQHLTLFNPHAESIWLGGWFEVGAIFIFISFPVICLLAINFIGNEMESEVESEGGHFL